MSRKLNLVLGLVVTSTFAFSFFGGAEDSQAQIFRFRNSRNWQQPVRVQPNCPTARSAQYYVQIQPQLQTQPGCAAVPTSYASPVVNSPIYDETTGAVPVQPAVQAAIGQSEAQIPVPSEIAPESDAAASAVFVEPIESTQTNLPIELVPAIDTPIEPVPAIDAAIEPVPAIDTLIEPVPANDALIEAVPANDTLIEAPNSTPPAAEPPTPDSPKVDEPTPAPDKSILNNN